MGHPKLSRVKDEISKAIEEIKKNRGGADIKEAKRRLKEAAGALEKNNVKKAEELAKEAQIIAHPTTDYLMAEGKKLSAEAKTLFDKKAFDDAISKWESSKDFYERASKLSDVRKDGLEQDISGTLEKLENNIKTAKKEKDRSSMQQGMAEGARLKTRGKTPLGRVENLEKSVDEYNKALELGKKWEFSEESSIDITISEIENQIRMELLAEAESLLDDSKTIDGYKKAEDFALSLEDNKWFKEDQENARRERLLNQARSSQLKIRVGKGKKLLEDARKLLDKRDEVAAKDKYTEAKNVFIELSSYAAKCDLWGQKREIDTLIEHASKGITASVKGLAEVEEIEEPISDRWGDRFEIAWNSVRHGGYADVYQAFDSKTRHKVALKRYRVHENATIPEVIYGKFMNEASVWMELCRKNAHKNIVTLYDYGNKPSPWLALEYMDDGSIHDRLHGLSVNEALEIIKEVIAGLVYAHKKKDIAHLDIKPMNILFSKKNEIKLTDWGQSKFVDEAKKSLYTTGGLTPEYAAPEQCDSGFGEKDIVTDIWQMGVLLYHVTTKKLPFTAADPQKLINAITSQEPMPPIEFPDIPPALDEVICTCLNKNKDDRYKDAWELQKALEDI